MQVRHVWVAGIITFALSLVALKISSSNGEALFPSMAGEIITLRLVSGGRIHVQVRYEVEGDLRSGQAMIFPETEWFPLENFKARWNGVSLPVVCVPAPADAYYSYRDRRFTAVHRFAIPPTERTGVRKAHLLENEYEYSPPYHGPGSKSDDPEGRYVEYTLVTGSTWRGPIGSVKVIFHTGGIPCEKITVLPGSYSGACTGKHTWEFHAENIVPDRDVRLLLPMSE
jgi:hypothetical protein